MSSLFGVRVWGARGLLPRMDRGQGRHGGNTVCLEVLHEGESHVILDAGTGLPNLGTRILEVSPEGGPIHLFLTHYHWDHVLGLPLFGPVYRGGFDVHLYGPGSDEGAMRHMLDTVFAAAYSPIYGPDNLLSNLIVPDDAELHGIDALEISCSRIAGIHPGGCCVYRVCCGGRCFVYAPDVELRERTVVDSFVAVCRGCDLLICGTTFTQSRYEQAVGWGHSSIEVVHEVAMRAGVGRLLGIHFDPLRDDAELEDTRAGVEAKAPGMPVELAREGQEVFVP